MKNSVVSHSVCTHVGGATLGPTLAWRAVDPYKHAPPPHVFPYQTCSLEVKPYGHTKNVGDLGIRGVA